MIDWLENIDREILFAINGANSSFLDQIMWIISTKFFGLPFYLILLYYIHKLKGWQESALFLVIGILAVGMSDLSAKYLFKELFERYRPSQNLEIQHRLHFVNNYKGGMYGFISNHSSNMFALTTYVYLVLTKLVKKKLLLGMFLFPIIIGYSRVYLGVHYPSDVIIGGLWGSLIGIIFYRIYQHQTN